jgi:hypothetical protein
MKQVASILAIFALATAGAVAGPYSSGKGAKHVDLPPPPPPPPALDCYAPGASFGIFGAYLMPEGSQYSDEFGGGVTMDYFWSEYFGVSAAYALFGTTPEIHHFTADLVARYPIRPACIAPYVLGGGGIHTNSETEGLGRVGAGIDIQVPALGGNSIFADYVYTFSGGDLEDFQTIRLGVKFNF